MPPRAGCKGEKRTPDEYKLTYKGVGTELPLRKNEGAHVAPPTLRRMHIKHPCTSREGCTCGRRRPPTRSFSHPLRAHTRKAESSDSSIPFSHPPTWSPCPSAWSRDLRPLVRRGDPSPCTECRATGSVCWLLFPPAPERRLCCGYLENDVILGTCRRGSKRTGGRQCGYAPSPTVPRRPCPRVPIGTPRRTSTRRTRGIHTHTPKAKAQRQRNKRAP